IRDQRSVVPGGIDEPDAEIDDAPEHLAHPDWISRLAPHHRSGNLHGAVAEPWHLEVTEADRRWTVSEIGHDGGRKFARHERSLLAQGPPRMVGSAARWARSSRSRSSCGCGAVVWRSPSTRAVA